MRALALLLPATLRAVAALGPPPHPSSCAGVDTAAARELRSAVSGDVLLPGDAAYPAATLQWSKTFARRPCVVLFCNTSADAAAGLRFATQRGLALSIRSGGHNYMGWSVLDGAVALDLSRLSWVRVRAGGAEADVGPGALSDDVVQALSQQHGKQTSTGGCPTVALGGFLLGGGHPIIARSTGTGLDNVLGMDVVLADGREVHVSATEHADLYWGLRGGCGSAFGIVTNFRMRLHDECSGAGACLGGHVMFRAEDAARVAAAFAAYAPGADPLLGLEAFGVSGAYPGQPGGGMLVTGVYNGAPADGWKALHPLLNIPNTTIIENTWEETTNYYDAWYRGIGGARDPDTAHRREDIQSAFFAAALPDSAWEDLMSGFLQLGVNGSVGMNAMGGAWSAPAVNATAYPHRKFLFNMEINTIWKDPARDDEVRRWSREAYSKYVAPHCGPDCEVYCNYPDGTLADFARAYWGPNLARLSRLKREWDPDGVFSSFPQAIPAAGGEL